MPEIVEQAPDSTRCHGGSLQMVGIMDEGFRAGDAVEVLDVQLPEAEGLEALAIAICLKLFAVLPPSRWDWRL